MTIDANLLTELKQFLPILAERSGAIIRRYFRTDLQVDSKDDATPVTLADRQAEACIRELIQQRYPDHGILGEEYGVHNPQAEFQWILDPVDGTKSFVAGAFDFGTIVGLTYQGQPVLGMIHHPILNELFIGDNHTATCNGKPLQVHANPSLAKSIVLTSDLLRVAEYQPAEGFHQLTQQTMFSRTWGNCYGYGLIAQGLEAVMIDPIAAIWDSMGVIPVVRGAGGIVTDYQGNDPVGSSSVVACSPAIHAQVIDLLNG